MSEKSLNTSYENKKDPMSLTRDELDISIRLYQLLKQNKLVTLSDIANKGEEEISKMRGYNPHMGKELAAIFKEKNLDYFQTVDKQQEEGEETVIHRRRTPKF